LKPHLGVVLRGQLPSNTNFDPMVRQETDVNFLPVLRLNRGTSLDRKRRGSINAHGLACAF
jgi:hypothetical protein